MDHVIERFLNDVVLPWNELNELLVGRFAFQEQISRPIKLARDISIGIGHLPEWCAIDKKPHLKNSADYEIMLDVCDVSKHNALRKAERQNSLFTGALFEYSDDSFSYMRNAIYVEHATHGKRDFMEVSAGAIKYCLSDVLNYPETWRGELKTSPAEFHYEAFLFYDARHQIKLENTRIVIYQRINGALEPFDPPEVRFAVYDAPSVANKF